MDETERLKNIIMSFRVQDLQRLLGHAQRNKSGNKNELQKRALTLIHKPQASIIVKIHEIQRSNQLNSKTLTAAYSRDPADQIVNLNAPDQYLQEFCSLATSYLSEATNAMEKQSSSLYPPSLINFPIQPDVRFKKLPFCEELSELLKASSLIPMPGARMQVSHFDFHLTPQQVQEIGRNRIVSASKVDYHVQVQVRIGLMETTCEQTDLYPPHLGVRVNNRLCQLPTTVNNARLTVVDTKNHARPLDITQQLRLSPTTTNTLTLEWMSEYGRAYAVRIALVRKLTAGELLRRLRARGYKPADYTRGLIKEKLAADDDTEISCSSWRVSVSCPLSKCRMCDPCRPASCRHLQCFDASVYLRMNECKATWQCPICDKPAPYEDLALDGYFCEVINSPRLSQSNELFIDRDGSWYQNAEVVKENEQEDNVELVILDDTDPYIETKFRSEDVECIADTPPLSVNCALEDFVVDLTQSDSSDEDIPLSVLAKSMRKSSEFDTTELRPAEVTRKSSEDSIVMLD